METSFGVEDCGNNHLAVRRFWSHYVGADLRMKPYERLLRVKLTGDVAIAKIETFVVREMSRQTRYEKRGVKLLKFTKVGSGYVLIGDPDDIFIMWDDNFVPTVEVPWGSFATPEQKLAKREWEADAYRVGSSRSPMDNAARTSEGHTTPAMERHWR